ncbi:MAG: hypothetical protein IJU95_02425 [Treponema sp.]|nr:hypothetical protein [Treponema sp.]
MSFRKAGTHRLSSWLTWGGLRKVVNYIIWGNVSSSYGRGKGILDVIVDDVHILQVYGNSWIQA